MSLLDLWSTARPFVQEKHIQQIISFAGDGKLIDNSGTSHELREFLREIPIELLIKFGYECLGSNFDQSGYALQDLVNEIGYRLGFSVSPGLYRGREATINYDGMWRSPEGAHIVVEVKTSDNYRIALDKLDSYRHKLINSNQIPADRSSILIVVGTQETTDLEAQIRGSRQAWDIRLVSFDGLVRLLRLKQSVEESATLRRIRDVLLPQDFTKVDRIIDLAFSAAEDLRLTAVEAAMPEEISAADQPQSEHKVERVTFHDGVAGRVSKFLGQPLLKYRRSIYVSENGTTSISCAISRLYERQGRAWYWFAFHPQQQEQLEQYQVAYAVFGCGSPETVFAFPLAELLSWLPGLNLTIDDRRRYWHIHISRVGDRWILSRKKGYESVDITPFMV